MKIQFKFTFYTLKKITIISFSLEKAFETNSKYIFEKKHSRIISNSFFSTKKYQPVCLHVRKINIYIYIYIKKL